MQIEPIPGGHVLVQEQEIPQPIERVWDFFSSAENLERLTPRFLNFQILTPGPIAMEEGALIDYRIRLFGVPMRWRTEIVEFHPPTHFVDRQLRGPYARWHHSHRFESVPGGTLMTDRVEYRVPLGPLGTLAHGLFVRRNLERIFGFRRTAVEEIFGPPPRGTEPADTAGPSRRGAV